MSPVRIMIAGLIVASGILALHSVKASAAPAQHQLLQFFPQQIGGWSSRELPFDKEVERAIGADDYTNREYRGGGRPVELYIGYYMDQHSGDAIHSPKNCLPGEGWEPVRSAQVQIGSVEHPILVNEYVVEQGAERDLVLYWYQTRGRIVASEYAAKFWLVADGLRRRRADGALVRIWTTAEDGEHSADLRATGFARRIYPQVAKFLPD